MTLDDYVDLWMNQNVSDLTTFPGNNWVTAEYLPHLWGIGYKQAQNTIKSTTRESLRNLEGQE